MKKLIKSQTAQSMIEFAFSLPIFMLLILGIVDFARISHTYIIIAEAARDAARVASISSTTANEATIRSNAQSVVDKNTVTVSGSIDSTIIDFPDNDVRIKVSAKVPVITPIVNAFISNPFPISGEVRMRLEGK